MLLSWLVDSIFIYYKKKKKKKNYVHSFGIQRVITYFACSFFVYSNV